MKSAQIARNYAEALFHLGREINANDQLEADLERLVHLVRTTRLRTFWHNPLVPKAEKAELAEELLAQAHPYTLNFARLLIERNRMDYLAQIYREFLAVRDRESRTLRVVVHTPYKLSKGDLDKLEKRLAQLSERDIRLSVVEDPAILGGIRLVIHDKLVDGSLLAQLDALRQQLLAGVTIS